MLVFNPAVGLVNEEVIGVVGVLTDELCCVDFLLTGVSSSESLLLELAAFFIVGVGTALLAETVGFVLFLSSSEESESDDESFFVFFDAITGVDTTGFFATGVTGALDATGFFSRSIIIRITSAAT